MEKDFLLAGELAKAVGVSTDTLRHYERKGVIKRPRRSSNGYRLYHKDQLDRLLLIRRAMSFGFTLDELARVLSERDNGRAPCLEVRGLVDEKLAEIKEQLASLTVLEKDLKAIAKVWDDRLAKSGPGRHAHLLENLPDTRKSFSKFDKKGKPK